MQRKLLFLVVCLCGLTLAVHAQPYSLQECRRMALENNALIQGKRLDQEVSEQLKKQAFTYYFPNVSAMGVSFEAQNSIIDLDLGVLGTMGFLKDGSMASAMAVQPIFMGGKIFYSNKLAKVGVQAAALFTQTTTDEVMAQTDEYYWTLVTLYEKRKTVAVMGEVLDSLFKDVSAAEKAGVMGRNDVLKVSLQRNTLKAQEVELENGISLCTMALARQIGCPVDSLEGFDIQVPQDSLFEAPAPYYVDPQEALALRTEYALLEAGVKAANLNKKIETSAYLPQVVVGAMYYYENFLDKNTLNGALMAAVRVPLSDWWAGSYAIRQKELALQKAKLEQEDGHQQLLLQMQQAWGAFVESYEKLLIADESVAQSEENARLNRDFFKAGTISLTEVMAAEGFLQMSYDSRTEAVKAYQIAKSTYLRVTGRPQE